MSTYDDFVFFFFQAEDGIRDIGVTGVQTCALPISRGRSRPIPARTRASRSAPPAELVRAARRSSRPGAAAAGRPVPAGVGDASWPPKSQELSPIPTKPCDSRAPEPANFLTRSAAWELFRADSSAGDM